MQVLPKKMCVPWCRLFQIKIGDIPDQLCRWAVRTSHKYINSILSTVECNDMNISNPINSARG